MEVCQDIFPDAEDFNALPSDAGRQLDYLFYSAGMRLLRWSVDRSAGTGSDHLPVIATFEID
jgi:endonuclease/exonuclease/phosphatase (EEP) superfamily protein YafD